MAIDDRIEQVRRLLERVRSYHRLLLADNFAPSSISDMKSNAKAICDQAKAETDGIKGEIDQWS